MIVASLLRLPLVAIIFPGAVFLLSLDSEDGQEELISEYRDIHTAKNSSAVTWCII